MRKLRTPRGVQGLDFLDVRAEGVKDAGVRGGKLKLDRLDVRADVFGAVGEVLDALQDVLVGRRGCERRSNVGHQWGATSRM